MKTMLGVITVFTFLGILLSVSGTNVSADRKVLRHVVLFKFKDTTTAVQIKQVEDAFRALPTKLSEVKTFEWGTNVSPENLAQGFTHCFLLTSDPTKIATPT